MKRSIILLFLGTLAAGAAVFPSDAVTPPMPETHALLEAVCPGTSYVRGKETGCHVCPAGRREDWSLAAVYYGHFVAAGSDDALLAVAGCEAHVNDFGGTILLTRQAGQWKKLSYHPGIITETCHKLKSKTGRELLVCEGGHTSQGVTDSVIYSLDFAAPPDKVIHLIFTAEDTTAACSTKVQNATIDKVTIAENGNMFVSARLGSVTLTAAQQQHCLDHPEAIKPVTREYRIEFRFDGEYFTVPPASTAAARAFR